MDFIIHCELVADLGPIRRRQPTPFLVQFRDPNLADRAAVVEQLGHMDPVSYPCVNGARVSDPRSPKSLKFCLRSRKAWCAVVLLQVSGKSLIFFQRTSSSIPLKSRLRFGMTCGSKVLSWSRGTDTGTSPYDVRMLLSMRQLQRSSVSLLPRSLLAAPYHKKVHKLLSLYLHTLSCTA